MTVDMEEDMYVTKRNGKIEIVAFDKILNRIKRIGKEVNLKINYTSLAMKVIDQLYNHISTTKIDELTAEQCASLASTHPDYNVMAGRILVSNHHKNTNASFSDTMLALYAVKDQRGESSPMVSHELAAFVREHSDELDAICDYERDYLIDYFGIRTLERAYLMRINGKIVERPQHMWLRVSIGIHGDNMARIRETYESMSRKYFTHATPTLFNSGTLRPQMSSCFLLKMENDSIDGIYNTLKDCAMISKWAGGIGLHIHNVRASGSYIRGTGGTSNGIVPMLRVFNNTAKYVDQCVTPDTIIYTNQGPIQIQHCNSGETGVYGLTGELEIIDNVLEHPYDGDLLVIDTMHSITPLHITPEHPIYVLRNQEKGLNYSVIKQRLHKKTCEFEWIDAKDVLDSDMAVYSIPKYECDISSISADDCYMYGVILGDGHMSNTDNNGYVSLHTENKIHILQFVEKYLTDKLIKCQISIDGNVTRIRWNRTINLPFRYNDVYDENNRKRAHYKWINLPICKSMYIVKGLIDSDGCKHKELTFDSTSMNLIETIRYICLRMGILTSGYVRDRVGQKHETTRGVIENKLISYCLRIPKTIEMCELIGIEYQDTQFFKFLRYENFLLTRIKSVNKIKYSGILYDLQMKKEHNYLLHNCIVHNGGGKRNGSFAIYLEPWHADIENFLQMRKNHGDEEMKARDLFYALWIPDLFMERVKTGGQWTLMCPDECPGLSDVYADQFTELYTSYESAGKGRKTMSARELWFQILDAQMETGTPYLLYKDAANKKSNQKNIGVIKSSNLCVAPETPILTDKGYQSIYTLCDKKVNVWNGDSFSEVTVQKTGVDQPLIEIHTNDGAHLHCTPYHKFYVYDSRRPTDVVVKEARELHLDDVLLEGSFPAIRNGSKEPTSDWLKGNAYMHGFYCGDGTYDTNKHIPPTEYDMSIRLEWFAGLCDAAGSLSYDTTVSSTPYIQITTMNREFLLQVKLMLQTCGINARVQVTPPPQGQHPYYYRNPLYRLWIYPSDVERLVLVGFSPKKIVIPIPKQILNPRANRTVNPPVQISKIIDNGRVDDTYCFSEPKRHMGVFGGILTGQCTEIMEVSTETETAVCNLASIGLPMFVESAHSETPVFNHEKLHDIARMVTYNLNCIIDVNFYPTEKTHVSNMRHRPIGIGVQGLADVFMMLNIPFISDDAKQINREIFETIYHGALVESCDLAKKHGAYETFAGSPASKGILQFDMWGVTPDSGRYDWDALKRDIQTYGLRNSLLLAPMPTASTSQILGFNECIEPITSNIYSRRTLAGEFIMANKYLMNDLLALDLWNEKIKNNIIANNGSVQQIDIIPPDIREKYRTVWEIPMRHLIDMSADRGAYICQSQSLNLWLEDPNYNSLTSMHFYSWNKGLKTGIYYLRRRGKHQAQQFTIEPEKKNGGGETVYEDDHEICEMCSS